MRVHRENRAGILMEPLLQCQFGSDILIYAFRYMLGRSSYGVGIMTDAIKEAWPALLEHDKALIHREIRQAIEQNFAGNDYDIQDWEQILLLPISPEPSLPNKEE